MTRRTAVLMLLFAAATQGQEVTTFERLFGVSGRLDPAMVAKVKALSPGERMLIDRDGDGKNDEAWFIDTAARHTAARRPILVRVIDEDGDLDAVGPDLDNDLYLADWHADGTVDSVVDYTDEDGDGDLDSMGIFFDEYQEPWRDYDHVKVWFSRDVGDDNLLWYDVDWSYEQLACQYRTHFSGDEVFYELEMKKGDAQWLNVFEDPFAFYDPDGDDCSEVVVRITAVGDEVKNLRYSVDADNDARGRHTHDYDFSLTGLPGETQVRVDKTSTGSLTVRGVPVHPVLRWDAARAFAQRAPWARVLLTWDELNANTDEDVARDPHERWEGVINHGSEHFPLMGAPACSALNKRNEVSSHHRPPLRLYYDPADRRIHLRGAALGWLDVDYDLDGRVDAKYSYRDTNGDGVFDERQIDLDADGTAEFTWPMGGEGVQDVPLAFEPLSTFYKAELDAVLAESQEFIDAAVDALSNGNDVKRALCLGDPVAAFFVNEVGSWMPATRLGERIRKTPGGARFYVDLIRDRMLARLRDAFGTETTWSAIESAYAAGKYGDAAALVRRGRAVSPNVTFGAFEKRVAIRIENASGAARDDWPVVIPVRAIQKVAVDFNTDNCAVVAPERWIDWREAPHQVDTIDERVGPELSFLADVSAAPSSTWYVYYSPQGKRQMKFARRTGTAEDWVPPNIGWESNRVAYRAYWGQFDYFGKKTDTLIYDTIGATSYHEETAWGVDALHVNETSGIGGVTLYRGDDAYLVQNPAGKGDVHFAKRMLVSGPIRAAIEIGATNVIPDQPSLAVRLVCVVYAEHQETEIRASITPGGDDVDIAPGLVKLLREQVIADGANGILGSWGYQEPLIGEIGMAVIVDPRVVVDVVFVSAERRLRCRAADGVLRYWVIGDWRRGRTFPISPTVENWERQLRALAGSLVNDVRVTVGDVEVVR